MGSPFKPGFIAFLTALSANNNRDWFNANKSRYESEVLEPALAFIEGMAERLPAFAPRFTAVAKRQGGSLMRIYRDVRFSRNKLPYKTNVGIQFRHELGRDVHAPGYYFHIDPESVFLGAGIWHPERESLNAIRDAIVERPQAWRRAISDKSFSRHFELAGSALTRPPRGVDPAHPLIEDLKRKDFIAISSMQHADLYKRTIYDRVTKQLKTASPLMRFLCKATGVRF